MAVETPMLGPPVIPHGLMRDIAMHANAEVATGKIVCVKAVDAHAIERQAERIDGGGVEQPGVADGRGLREIVETSRCRRQNVSLQAIGWRLQESGGHIPPEERLLLINLIIHTPQHLQLILLNHSAINDLAAGVVRVVRRWEKLCNSQRLRTDQRRGEHIIHIRRGQRLASVAGRYPRWQNSRPASGPWEQR